MSQSEDLRSCIRLLALAVAVVLSISIPPALADETIITFEDFPTFNGDVDDYYASQGIIFSTGDWRVWDETFGGAVVPASGTQWLRPFGGVGSSISFVVPETSEPGVVDSFSWVDLALANFGWYDGYTVAARDVFGTILDSASVPYASYPPGRSASTLTLNGPGIHEIEITSLIINPMGQSSQPFDNITFGTVRAVPEPVNLTLLALGGAMLRRRRK